MKRLIFTVLAAGAASLTAYGVSSLGPVPFSGSGLYCDASKATDSCVVVKASGSGTQEAQDLSSFEEVRVITERGVGADADYIPAGRLVVAIDGPQSLASGPDSYNAYDAFAVLTTKRLAGDGMRQIIRNQATGALSLSSAEEALADYVKKDTVVLVGESAGTETLTVDASSGLAGKNAGDVVVVANAINSLTVKANGYDGKAGESPLLAAAKKAVDKTYQGFQSLIPDGLSRAFKESRAADQSLNLQLTQQDLDNYEASGLACRTDETPLVGANPANSYALDQAGSSFLAVAEGINLVAYGREEAKRTLCRRPAEMSAIQSCAADREFSWQIACSINPEQRSVATFKREPVKWQRLLCGQSTTSQIRRKIVRQANVTINIPGGKSYSGLITRSVSFADAAQVYVPNNRAVFFPSETGKWMENCSKKGYQTSSDCLAQGGSWSANGSLSWYNPFWGQDIAGGSTIEVQGGVTVPNTATESPYPAASAENPNHNKGAALTFIPRPASDGEATLLFTGSPTKRSYVNSYNADTAKTYSVSQSCANIIDVGAYATRYGLSGVYGDEKIGLTKTRAMGAPGSSGGGPSLASPSGTPWYQNPERYPTVEYLLAFDSRDIGFTHDDLVRAASPTSSGFIQITNCTSYEVMDGVVTGDVSRGEWALTSGAPDESDLGSSSPSLIPSCPQSKPSAVGSETFVQYEDDAVCSVNNPMDPPSWLKEKVRADQSLPADMLIRGSDIPVDALSSKAYVSADSFAGGFPAGSVPTVSELNKEFIWPGDMTPTQTQAVTATDRENYCVEPPASLSFNVATGIPEALIGASRTERWKVTRARVVQMYGIPASSATGVAIPTGAVKKTCDRGVRLDTFLTQVQRPTCRDGSSSKLKLAWWSDRSSANTWRTWTSKNQQSGVLTQEFVGAKHSIKSESTETRYDDLPSTILSSYTNEVDPSEFISSSQSATGKAFPPTYGFESADGNRTLPAWMRESSLVSGATALSYDSFVPYAGVTNESRKAQWCNAQAFSVKNGKFIKSFGARGILRDPAKHVYGFNVTKTLSGSPQTKKYVAIEVSGTSEQYGFYIREDSFPDSVASRFNAGADTLSQYAGSLEGLFKKKSYPNIGGRFAESCLAGESYNQFTGFCHATSENDQTLTGSWRASRRTVERYDPQGERSTWAVRWTITDQILAAVKRLNDPFGSKGTDAPAGGLTVSDLNANHLARMGVFRPVADMASDESGLETGVVVNRPETLSQPARGPYFAEPVASTDGGICRRRMRMIAVPVPDTTTDISGITTSVVLDQADDYLPTAGSWGSLFLALDYDCGSPPYNESTAILVRGSLIERSLSGITNLGISSGSGFTKLGRDSSGDVTLSFFSAAGGAIPQVMLSSIKESFASGISATTGYETLSAGTVKVKQRDRASEWTAAGRAAAGKGWQSKINTEPTVPVSDGTITALSCSPSNLRRGTWGKIAGAPEGTLDVTNASPLESDGMTLSTSCRDNPSVCALTEEELSLYTKTVPDSLTPITTRPAVEQYTPWSFELTAAAPRTSDSSAAQFGSWTKATSDGAGAPTPSCDIFKSSSPTDDIIPRTSIDAVPSDIRSESIASGTIDIRKPGTVDEIFMSVKLDQDLRRSDTCIEWDKVTGKTCLNFQPSIGRSDLAPYVFGGNWTRVTVETSPRRVSQDCGLFKKDSSGMVTEVCEGSARPLIASVDICDPSRATSSLCVPCPGSGTNDKVCAPWMLPKEPPTVTLCKPGLGGCPYETQSSMQQVETSVPMPGRPGENGTDGGSVSIFCGDCGNIAVENRGGLGGMGSTTVSSSVSKNLTCGSWNNNPLDPKFFYRVLWSKPFDSAGNGQNGVRGQDGGTKNVYSDLTPEAIYYLSRPEFWKTGSP